MQYPYFIGFLHGSERGARSVGSNPSLSASLCKTPIDKSLGNHVPSDSRILRRTRRPPAFCRKWKVFAVRNKGK